LGHLKPNVRMTLSYLVVPQRMPSALLPLCRMLGPPSAVANVADLNPSRGARHGAGGVGKEELFLVGSDEAEELAWLGIVIGVFSMIPVVGICPPGRRGGSANSGLLLPFPVAVWLVAQGTAMITVNPHVPSR